MHVNKFAQDQLKGNMCLIDALFRYKYVLALLFVLITVLYYNSYRLILGEWLSDENNSHGLLIPFVSAYILWRRRSDLLAMEVSPDPLGLILVITGSTLVVLGNAATEFFTMRVSLIVLMLGILLALFGRRVFQQAYSAIAFLIFMIPVPEVLTVSFAFPLKMFISSAATKILKFLDVAVLQEGNIIILPAMSLEVVDACSGVRSLVSLAAVSVAYTIIRHVPLLRQVAIVSFTLPAIVICNLLRLLITALLVQYVTVSAANGLLHDAIGYFTFAFSFLMLIFFGELMMRSK